ncbi:MAG: hypothetical protein IPK91_12350 [Saprospiraceae bacterium]|nr:hypothetical protein [Saprospiraceae bacterium]
MNLVSKIQGRYFVGTNIPATPYGLKSGAYLVQFNSTNPSGGEKLQNPFYWWAYNLQEAR